MRYKKTAVALLACTAFAAQAQAANVATEFSVLPNPGGAWSYGYTPSLGENFNLNLFNWTFGSTTSIACGWSGQDPAHASDANPSVLYLINGSGPLFNYWDDQRSQQEREPASRPERRARNRALDRAHRRHLPHQRRLPRERRGGHDHGRRMCCTTTARS